MPEDTTPGEYPPGYGYDPTFDFEMPPMGYVAMALAAMVGFAAVGVGAFFVGTGTVGPGITINGVTYYGVTQQTAQALAAIGNGAMTVEASNTITASAIMGGGSALNAAGILALGGLNFNHDAALRDHMRHWVPYTDHGPWADDCSYRVGDYCLE